MGYRLIPVEPTDDYRSTPTMGTLFKQLTPRQTDGTVKYYIHPDFISDLRQYIPSDLKNFQISNALIKTLYDYYTYKDSKKDLTNTLDFVYVLLFEGLLVQDITSLPNIDKIFEQLGAIFQANLLATE